MNRENSICDPALVDRFSDDEVSRDERARVEAHLADCASCRNHLEANRALGGLLQNDPDHRLTGEEKTALENRLVAKMHKRRRWKWAGRDGLLRPKRLAPLAAVAGMLLFVFTFFSEPDTVAGPSAIVTSFQGDYTSVMIVETPETRNTIIWFDETT